MRLPKRKSYLSCGGIFQRIVIRSEARSRINLSLLISGFYQFFRTSLGSGVKPFRNEGIDSLNIKKVLRLICIDRKIVDITKECQSVLRQAELDNSQH